MAATASPLQSAVDDQLWTQLTRRIVRDEQVTMAEAEEIMEETMAFLLECASGAPEARSPSEKADIGWHIFILYTKDYHNWCMEHAGRFLHHSPLPIEVEVSASGDPICVNNCSCSPSGCCSFS